MNDSLGDRMKEYYEVRNQSYLIRRTPVIIRLDGKAFHTLTRKAEKPFDSKLKNAIVLSVCTLLNEIQGSKCAYLQSDEISILVTDFDKLDTQAWFDYNVQKMCSISAAVMSTAFSYYYGQSAVFDSRVFNIPREEVCNYFIWRQKDWIRNSVQMLARANFSHKECFGKSIPELHELLYTKDINWAKLEAVWKNGTFITKVPHITGEIRTKKFDEKPAPIFTENREAIENLIPEV